MRTLHLATLQFHNDEFYCKKTYNEVYKTMIMSLEMRWNAFDKSQFCVRLDSYCLDFHGQPVQWTKYQVV